MRQDPKVTAEYERVASEYIVPFQQAGLRPSLIDICKADSSTPGDLRKTLLRRLQQTLPASVPGSIRADASHTSDEAFVRTEARVKETVQKLASEGPILREVITHDRTGRAISEFVGAKRNWMNQFKQPLQIMKRCGNTDY